MAIGFAPSLEADAKRFGMRVSREEYPAGYAGVRLSLNKIAQYIREGASSPAMRQFAEGVIRQAGYKPSDQITDHDAASELLRYCQANIRYRPDPVGTEYTQHAAITLCVSGAAMCIPVADCDCMVVALGSLMAAYGIEVRVMKQSFGDSNMEHVLVVCRAGGFSQFGDTGGEWLAADACAPNKPLGWRQDATTEVIVNPMDPASIDLVGAPEGEMIGVGRPIEGGEDHHPTAIQIGALDNGVSDVLAYRLLWDSYVVGTAQAWINVGDAWATLVAGATPKYQPLATLAILSAPEPSRTSGMRALSQNAYELGQGLLDSWNLYAGKSDSDILILAPNILAHFQSVVLRAGQDEQPAIQAAFPTMPLPTPPDFSYQAIVVSRIEGAGIVAGGLLQLLGIGVGGALQTYGEVGKTAKKVVEKTTDNIPLLAGAVMFLASAYIVGQLLPFIPRPQAAREKRRRRRA